MSTLGPQWCIATASHAIPASCVCSFLIRPSRVPLPVIAVAITRARKAGRKRGIHQADFG